MTFLEVEAPVLTFLNADSPRLTALFSTVENEHVAVQSERPNVHSCDLILMSTLINVLYLAIALLLARFWWQTMQAREQAEKLALIACKRENVQLLDGTVSLKKFTFEKDKNGRRVFLRYFSFPFSTTGADRHTGTIAMFRLHQYYLVMDLPEQRTITVSPDSE